MEQSTSAAGTAEPSDPSGFLPAVACLFLVPPIFFWWAFLLGRLGRDGLVTTLKALPDWVQVGALLASPALAGLLGLIVLLRAVPPRPGRVLGLVALGAGAGFFLLAAVSFAV